ncbi:MAG: bacteriohemerythrin [Planctomycetota bacterium]|jgi:hemerythrin
MEKIEWDPSFSVGVKLLDTQHKQIIEMVNRLISDADTTVRSETVSELLTRLTKYANEHFQTEERLLREHGYPDLARHEERHKAFRKQVVDLCQDAMAHVDSVPEELLRFLKDWWTEHILKSDLECRSFFEERGID